MYVHVSPSKFSRDSAFQEPQENSEESVRAAALIVLSFASAKLQISFPFDCINIDHRKIKIPKPTLETHRKADPRSGKGLSN
jgi:hypothetical protein